MVYPFWTFKDLETDGSYWKKFEGQLKLYSKEQKNLRQEKNKKNKPKENINNSYKF